ncbi:stage II sporulation protein P [Salipaludibacillus neizhouensis]|uniref:Stage II sporulation protein P n=1 Tax=Salipaludibacillus neizhouensis TaxID=885475 RepID=A0A3A9KVM5_9BACI|nr:stage II sporulation protein P [Salipaludibacillus neizhouensis]RKL68656.1 stage II sporulation protein P [Salipaludibacillus neizhouensis]
MLAAKHLNKNNRRLIGSKRTSPHKKLLSFIFGVITIFFLTATLTTLGPGYSLTSASIHEVSHLFSAEDLVSVMGKENRYLQQSLPDGYEEPSVAPVLFEIATNLDPDDPRSLLGRELPGFSLFDGKILTAGEGSDYTNMPIESAPPMEVLLAEREASTERIEELDELKQTFSEENKEELPVTVHIVHTHNRESYLPELQNSKEALHESVNITLVGERLGLELAKYGIGAEVDTTDIGEELNARQWDYSQSYDMSREIVQEASEKNDDLQFYFDLHRDSQPKEVTTVEMNGESYAKTLFVIGENNPNYQENEALANELHKRLQDQHYGLSRGIFAPNTTGGGKNGVYNQDLSNQAMLVEFGGVENSLEEVYRSIELFAKVFSEYYWENQESEE